MSQPPDTGPGWGTPAQPAAWASPSGAPGPEAGPAPDSLVPPPAPGPSPAGPGGAPGAGVPPPAPPGPVPPGPTPPGYGPPGAGFVGGWRAPALQPGIIPLRPLGLGEILDGAMKAVRFNPAVMFGLSVVVVTVCVVLGTLASAYGSGFLTDWIAGQGSSGHDFVTGGGSSVLTSMLGLYGAELVVAAAAPLLTGLLIVAVSRAALGQKVSIGEVVRSRAIWAVLGFTVLLNVVVVVVVSALVVVVVVLAVQGGGSTVVAVALGVAGALALLAGWVWLTTRTLLIPPALMLEGGRFWPTLARGWRLTRGSFWRLFGIYLLVTIMLSMLTSIVSTPVTGLAVPALASAGVTWASLLAGGAITIVVETVTIVFQSSVVALLYLDVRMRREGLDLELARAATQVPPS